MALRPRPRSCTLRFRALTDNGQQAIFDYVDGRSVAAILFIDKRTWDLLDRSELLEITINVVDDD